jgi:hypothetical protein
MKQMVKKQIIKSFCGCFTDRGGFSKEPLAAGGIFARASTENMKNFLFIFAYLRVTSRLKKGEKNGTNS